MYETGRRTKSDVAELAGESFINGFASDCAPNAHARSRSRLKILFYCHYFPPEVNAPATRTYEHARRWVEAGHDVTVVTCNPNCPDGVIYEGHRNRFRRQVEMVDGIRVVRVWTYLAANAGKLRRITNFVSYTVSALLATVRLSRPDVVIATSPQFFCGWAGVWASRLMRRPLVLEIRDIWPESIEAVGAMKKGRSTRLLEWLELRMYQSSRHIIAVGTGYRDKILAKVPEMRHRISVVTNGVDAETYVPSEPDHDFLKSHGLEGKFVCSYVGTVGMAHGLSVIVRAAKRLKELKRTDIAFLIVGDGADRKNIEKQAIEAGVTDNVIFAGRLPKDQTPTVLASSDCCLIHLCGRALFETVIPSKIFETLAMQRPIIMGVKGPARDIVLQCDGGHAMEPDQEDDLVEAVIKIADDDPQDLRDRSASARQFVLEHYNRDDLADELLQLINEVVGGKGLKKNADSKLPNLERQPVIETEPVREAVPSNLEAIAAHSDRP